MTASDQDRVADVGATGGLYLVAEVVDDGQLLELRITARQDGHVIQRRAPITRSHADNHVLIDDVIDASREAIHAAFEEAKRG